MNPYLIVAALLAVMGSAFGGFRLGVDHEKAGQVDKQALVAEAMDAANASAALAISKIQPKYTTINNKVQHEISTETVYRDPGCRHTPVGLQLINDALAPPNAKPTVPGKLP